MGKLIDLNGKRFGKLIATNIVKKIGNLTKRLCHCDCGKDTWAQTTHLTNGNRVSCGCAPGMKLPSGKSARNEILNSYKQSAKYRKVLWLLTDEEFDLRILSNCYYCGSKPSNLKNNIYGNGSLQYNGIDRVNNNLGYAFDNTVSCCYICNRAKGTLTDKKFQQWIKNLIAHQQEDYYE